MKFRNAQFIQEGGGMATPAGAPAGGEGPMAMLMQGAQQAL
jgi:hypothetical protein